jgi:hypothetical protein
LATAWPPLWVKERAELKPPAVAVTAVVIASYAAVLTATVADLSASRPADLPIAAAATPAAAAAAEALESRAAALLMTVVVLKPLAWERPFERCPAGGGNPRTPTRAPLGGGIARAAASPIDSPASLPTGSSSGAGACFSRSGSGLIRSESSGVALWKGSSDPSPGTRLSSGRAGSPGPA